jgi:hypothetical protein
VAEVPGYLLQMAEDFLLRQIRKPQHPRPEPTSYHEYYGIREHIPSLARALYTDIKTAWYWWYGLQRLIKKSEERRKYESP